LEQCHHAEARDLAKLGRRHLSLGHRVVSHAFAHGGQDLIRASPCGRDEKYMTEASFIAAVLLDQLSKLVVVRGSNAALLALGRAR
jgi:hypothetical protein